MTDCRENGRAEGEGNKESGQSRAECKTGRKAEDSL